MSTRKKYTENDLQALEPILPSILKNSEIYIGIEYENAPYELVCYKLLEKTVATAVFFCGAMPVITDYCDGFYVVSSDKNWFAVDDVSEAKDLFFKLVGIGDPEIRFGFRMEVVLNAMANNVVLVENAKSTIIKGDIEEVALQRIMDKYPNKYLIAFN